MAVSIVLERPFSSGTDHAQETASLNRQHVYILPTRHGYILAIVLFTMLLGAINYNNNMGYILTFLLGSIFMVSMVHTYRNLAGLIINSAAPKAVYAGETALFPLIIDNRRRMERPGLVIGRSPEDPSHKKRRRQKHPCVYFSVPADGWQQVDLPITETQRGVLRPGRMIISTSFPLGLFRAWSYLHFDSECIIYPKPEGSDRLPPPLALEEQGESGDKSGVNDFAGFRQYHPGDSIRNIAWKVLAREQPLLVKRFSGDGRNTCLLTWNQVQHLPDAESRLSQLCVWLLRAAQQNKVYGVDIPGARLDPAEGTAHLHRCLEALARF